MRIFRSFKCGDYLRFKEKFEKVGDTVEDFARIEDRWAVRLALTATAIESCSFSSRRNLQLNAAINRCDPRLKFVIAGQKRTFLRFVACFLRFVTVQTPPELPLSFPESSLQAEDPSPETSTPPPAKVEKNEIQSLTSEHINNSKLVPTHILISPSSFQDSKERSPSSISGDQSEYDFLRATSDCGV
ncbi:predicted protein [Arabidopsis lyrata subsp. lyrata]|uniref:Predicted protein n=1 Tax=Arabidopsis lyrata subsp. lyrata TaxID=81972 RepID=D7KRY4_ARALL|nr:predicted protein [Arabidopsis lyrata subsp. lyrata]